MATPAIRQLQVEKATPESVKAFGEIVGVSPGMVPLPTAFYEGKVRLFAPAAFTTDDDTELTVARMDRREMKVQWMERHFKHTQAFIPLGGKPFVVVLAPPTDTELPILDQARAFLFDGSAGFAMHIGTWHEFPFAIVDDTDVIVILRREATRGLMKDVVIDGEAKSPDIDKKDIARRTGVVFEARL
jgi:ureidoglycolate lyase